MTYDELVNLLLASGREDWIVDDAKGTFILKTNLDVSLREQRNDDFEYEGFHEEWATKFPDPVAYKAVFELWFRNSPVKTYHFVSVDGARALLPYPKAANDLTITHEEFAIADVVNFSGNRTYFEEYIRRFKIEN